MDEEIVGNMRKANAFFCLGHAAVCTRRINNLWGHVPLNFRAASETTHGDASFNCWIELILFEKFFSLEIRARSRKMFSCDSIAKLHYSRISSICLKGEKAKEERNV